MARTKANSAATEPKKGGSSGAGSGPSGEERLGASLPDEAFSYHTVNAAHVLGLEPQAWAVSRPLDEGQVQTLCREQAKRIARGLAPSLFLPAPITIAVLRGQHYLMDGQLRLEVLRRLALEPISVSLSLCEVRCSTTEELEELYTRLHGGAALPESYYKKKFAQWAESFTAMLAKAFPKSVSSSDRPRRPNFNLALVRKSLAALPALQRAVAGGMITAEKLMEVVHSENAIEAQVSSAGGGWKLTTSLVRKAKNADFPLGLRCNWVVAVAVRALASLGL